MINKKILVTLSATTAIFFMLLSPSITSYAAEPEEKDSTVTATDTTVEVGNVTITDGSSAVDADNSNVIVDQNSTVTATNTTVEVGNVTITNGSSAVDADYSNVTVHGNITTSGTNGSYQDNEKDVHKTASPAVDANNSTVTVNGSISAGNGGVEQTAITATNGSNVTVGENVSGTYDGINSTSSTVTVNGNVSGSHMGISASSSTENGVATGTDPSTITVNGNVTTHGIQQDIYNSTGTEIIDTSIGGTGVYSYGENNIVIDGNVYSKENGVEINIGNGSFKNDGYIVVDGTITGTNGISIHDNDQNSTFKTTQEIIASTPEITVYEIDSEHLVSVSMHNMDWDSEVVQEAEKQIVEAINYIIRVNESDAKTYGITVSGDNIVQNGGHDTVNMFEDFTVAANLTEGYTIDGGQTVRVIDNHDGTFTLRLGYSYGNPYGGIYVRVKPVQITNADGSTSYVVEAEPYTEPATEPYNDPTQAPAGSIVVTTNTGNDTSTSEFTTAISGDKPAQTISFTMSSVTPQQYKNAIISSVASVPSNGAFNIVTDTIGCLDAGMIEALSARPDIDVNIVFYYGGKQMKVTIPAGYDLNSLLDEHGYCGFLRLMSILGGTEI